MRAYLAPYFLLLFSVSMLIFLAAALKWRAGLYKNGHYLPLIALFLFPFSFFLMSNFLSGGVNATLGSAAPMLMVGSGVLFIAALLLVVIIARLARGADQGSLSQGASNR